MKTRIISPEKMISRINKIRTGSFIASLTALFFLFSASTLIPQADPQKPDIFREKKLDLLEKLENGSKVTLDDIKSSFGDSYKSGISGTDLFLFQDPDLPDVHMISPYDHHHNLFINDNEIINEEDMNQIHKELAEHLGDLKREIESFRNSDEFMNFKEGFKRWSNEFKKEMDRVGEEIGRLSKEARNKSETRAKI
jgi:hypothetical protein